jgi:hypothetical protein
VICESVDQRKAATGLRRNQGVLNLAKKYGSAACATHVRLGWNWVLPSIPKSQFVATSSVGVNILS